MGVNRWFFDYPENGRYSYTLGIKKRRGVNPSFSAKKFNIKVVEEYFI
jgi:hypothetical protein